MATTAENITKYSMQLSLVTQLGAKKTKTVDDVLMSVAVGYMATEEGGETTELTKFDNYARAMAALTAAVLNDNYLTAKTSTDELLAIVEG